MSKNRAPPVDELLKKYELFHLDLLLQRRAAEAAVQALSSKLSDRFRPTNGPLRLFHHLSNVVTRLKEVDLLLERLHSKRIDLLHTGIEFHEATSAGIEGSDYTPEFHQLSQTLAKYELEMSVDFQSMIMFCAMVLDEIAQIAAHVVGRERPYTVGFDQLAKSDGAAPFDLIWKDFRNDILWLDAIPRLFRNKMMVHREQPWQIGTSRDVYGMRWTFWVPIAAGWYSDAERNGYLAEINLLLGKVRLPPSSDDLHDAVLRGLDNIALFESEDRASLRRFAAQLGFATPSFQTFEQRLYQFLEKFLVALADVVESRPDEVDLGARE